MSWHKLSKYSWQIGIFLIFFIFIIPIGFVISSLFGGFNDNWNHLIDYVLADYALNSLFLISGVSVLSLIFGVGSAWLVTNYEFINKNWLEWALILPLAVPPYILAYTFTGLFDTYGSANELIRLFFNLKDNFPHFFCKALND